MDVAFSLFKHNLQLPKMKCVFSNGPSNLDNDGKIFSETTAGWLGPSQGTVTVITNQPRWKVIDQKLNLI